MKYTLILSLILLPILATAQVKQQKMNNSTNNPLLCDLETGICEIADSDVNENSKTLKDEAQKKIKIIYYTDPICSSCWGIEPQLRKLKLEYGKNIEVEYRMGGLLPDWSYNRGGISKPSDVAHHWDEVSEYYDMPIDGDIWFEDPLNSSYPPSIAFKAAELQSKEKALLFLREIREMVFLQKKNIAKWENISLAAQKVGLDVHRLQEDYEGKAKTLFSEDLQLGRNLGVRGFPTMYFVDSEGKYETIYGSKPFGVYEQTLKKLQPKVEKNQINKNWNNLFAQYQTLTSREFAELSGMPRNETDAYLQKLVENGELTQIASKNGSLWKKK